MNNKRALDLISDLWQNDYPCSEEIILKEFLERAEVAQAMSIAYNAIIEVDFIARARWIPKNSGFDWSEVEDNDLKRAFGRGVSINTLAAYHQRSESAIRSRLTGLGLRK